MKINNAKKDKFLNLIVKEGKSIPTIAEKLEINIDDVYALKEELDMDIIDLKAKEYDKIVQKYGLSYLNQFKYRAELYKRLKSELDNRDFTGLPTDKLYYILNHVQEELNATIDYVINPEDDDIDYLDDYFEEESEI
ncbi:MAG: hypothetical protein KAS18_03695 [Calditrichia bacterium]|nr:hypothetical protein [Calditrichia bacterium]